MVAIGDGQGLRLLARDSFSPFGENKGGQDGPACASAKPTSSAATWSRSNWTFRRENPEMDDKEYKVIA